MDLMILGKVKNKKPRNLHKIVESPVGWSANMTADNISSYSFMISIWTLWARVGRISVKHMSHDRLRNALY